MVEILSIMKLFTIDEEKYIEIKNYYIEVYKINQENLNKEIRILNEDNDFSIHKSIDNLLI